MHYTELSQSDQDVVQRIIEDYTIPVNNQHGGINFLLSRDIGAIEGIVTQVQIHNLVQQIAKSEQPAVKFETTIHGKTCLAITAIGNELYRILLSQHRFIRPPRQVLSDEINLWDEITCRILGSNAHFLGDPMYPINGQGEIEGELLNSLVIRLREATRRKAYKSKRDQHRKDVQRIFTATTKLVTRLLELHPALFGVRFDLMYRQECSEDIILMESAEHIQGLIEALKGSLWFENSGGYFWTRKFLSETGYRITLFLLFDANTTPINMNGRRYALQKWLEITKGTGLDCDMPLINTPINSLYHPSELLRYIEVSKNTARYLRLNPVAQYSDFGISDLPSRQSLAQHKQNLTETFSNYGRVSWNLPEDPSKRLTGRFK